MSEPTSTGNDEARAAASGPGDRLQAARIERGIALEDLANQMHLSVGILESLENNRFEDITAPIFVKGYLRSYARIVELDEGEILELYVSEYMESDPPISSTTTSAALPSRRRRRSGLWRWWLILLLIALALGAWWYQRSLQTAETISLDAASEPPAVAPGQQTGAVAGPAAGLSGEVAQRLEQLPPLQAGELPIREEMVPPPQAPAEQPAEAMPEPAEATAVDRPVETAAQEVTAEPPPAVAEPAPTPQQTPAAQDSGQPLQLRVTADTWADIRDASGRKLVYDLLRAGRRLELDGEPPLRLFFGNGRGVELRWNGQVIELENKIRADNTVRITLE